MKVVLLILCFCFSCTKKQGEPYNYHPPADSLLVRSTDTAKTYLALGDSYTIGQSVSENERFPAQTVALLKQQGITISSPSYIAQTGWPTSDLQQAIATNNPSPTFDIVSLLIGVNDQYQHMDTSGYAVRFTQLLQKAIELAKGKKTNVFVLSIPDYSATPFVAAYDKARVSKEIDEFNAINKRITTAYSVSYTDITPISREAASNPSFIANDNLHPSGSQYAAWVQLLVPKIKSALQ